MNSVNNHPIWQVIIGIILILVGFAIGGFFLLFASLGNGPTFGGWLMILAGPVFFGMLGVLFIAWRKN
jgi:hypothetical protein